MENHNEILRRYDEVLSLKVSNFTFEKKLEH
jgi:hypothetical protein